MGCSSSKYVPPKPKSVQFPKLIATFEPQHGKFVAITGTTSGTGLVAAKEAARLGAHVLLLNRRSERSEASLAAVRAAVAEGNGAATAIDCDLMDMESVRRACERVHSVVGANGLDVLVNNAGVMALEDKATNDGYDVQMQVNHLSHFLLTARLFPLLAAAAASRGEARVVNHSSIARKGKALDGKYLGKNGGSLGGNGASMLFGGARWERYHQTKLANCVFTAALAGKLDARERGPNVKALVAHPGLAATNLQATTAEDGGMGNGTTKQFMKMAQSMEDGACGILTCMFQKEVSNGDFYGPKGAGFSGQAVKLNLETLCTNPASTRMLWELSEQACGPFTVTV